MMEKNPFVTKFLILHNQNVLYTSQLHDWAIHGIRYDNTPNDQQIILPIEFMQKEIILGLKKHE